MGPFLLTFRPWNISVFLSLKKEMKAIQEMAEGTQVEEELQELVRMTLRMEAELQLVLSLER